MALDELTDVTDTAPLSQLINKGVNSEFEVTEELAFIYSMHGIITGKTFSKLKKYSFRAT